MADLVRILSIDGGGIRGLIPGQVLVHLEQKLQAKKDDPDARVADYFDLIAGTSTGGILGCMYLFPQDVTSSRPKFSAREAVALYLEHGERIFDVPFWHKVKSIKGFVDEKYPAGELEETLKTYFGDISLGQLLGPCLITAYDVGRRRAHFFTQLEAQDDPAQDFLVRDVARATSAAPTYFETAQVRSESGVSYPFIDGGVFANNPTLCAYAEARKFHGQPRAKDMLILSLGTGASEQPYDYQQARNWGLTSWIKPLIDIMMSGVSETVDYQLRQIFDAIGKPEQYLRLQTDLDDAGRDLDDASEENMKRLSEIGTELAETHAADLDRLVDVLVS